MIRSCLYILSFLILCTSAQAMKREREEDTAITQIEEQREKEQEASIEWRYRWSGRAKRLKTAVYQISKCAGIGCAMYYGQNYPFLQATLGVQALPIMQTTLGELKDAVWSSDLAQEIDALELRFLKKKHLLSEDIIIDIGSSLAQARHFAKPKSMYAYSGPHEEKQKLNAIRKLQMLVNIPVKTKKVTKSIQAISEEIDEYFSITYDPDLRSQLKKLAFQIVKRATGGTTALRKRPVFFLGSPGTGKTTTAQELARILERPFCHLNLSKLKPEQLAGKVSNGDELPELGEIAKCLIQKQGTSNVLDPIIFLDEIHDAINQKSKTENRFQAILKELLDPDQRWFKDEALGVKLDVSNVIFILAGNQPPSDCEGALGQRMTTLVFPSVTKEARVIIADKHLKRVAKSYDYSLKEDDFDMMQQILKADSHDGARILISVIESYISHRAAIQERIISADTKFDIVKEFEMASGLSNEDWKKREHFHQ